MPTPDQVLYEHPNPDGSRKKCGNCVMWSGPVTQRCAILPGKRITDDMVCGYHTAGTPSGLSMNARPADPKTVGLVRTANGTSCSNCKAYQRKTATGGECQAVQSPDGGHAKVEALGCCTMWTKREA